MTAAPTLGISTYQANAWWNTWRNTPFTVGVTAFQLHLGIPGGAGTAYPSATTIRSAATFTVAANGILNFTTSPPIFNMLTDETVAFFSVWDNMSGGNFLASGQIVTPGIVADGDVYVMGTCILTQTLLASG
jgi:hypothetical protein